MEYGSLNLNQTLRDYGYVGDLSVRDGIYYPSKAPLISFAAVPIYAILRAFSKSTHGESFELRLVYFSRLFLTVLPTLGLLFLISRFLQAYLPHPFVHGLVATYALGTLGLSYSLLLMSHQTTAVLLFCTFYLLWKGQHSGFRLLRCLLAGATAALAVTAEYTASLGVAVLLIYGWKATPPPLALKLKAFAAATLGAAPFLAALMLYHRLCFGHPLQTGYLHLNDAAYAGWHQGGFLGIGLPHADALALSLFSPLRGLFILSPVLLLSLPGMWRLRGLAKTSAESRSLYFVTLTMMLAYAYFTSSFSYASWGWTTGPRHLTGLIPFLLLPVGLQLQQLIGKGGWRAGAAIGLCIASILVTGTASLVNYIPDSATNLVFGVLVPLVRHGYTAPTVASLLGFSSPYLGIVLGCCLGIAALLVGAQLILRCGKRSQAVLGVLGSVAIIALVFSACPVSAQDSQAVQNLERSWIHRP